MSRESRAPGGWGDIGGPVCGVGWVAGGRAPCRGGWEVAGCTLVVRSLDFKPGIMSFSCPTIALTTHPTPHTGPGAGWGGIMAVGRIPAPREATHLL